MRIQWGISALILASAAGCASARGDLAQNIGLSSNVPAPSRPAEPSWPEAFPSITIFHAQTTEPGAVMPVSDVRYALAPDDGAPEPEPEEPLPTPKNLPPAPTVESDSGKVAEFNEAANRATSRVFMDDYDDSAILLSLREQLRTDPELVELQPVWTEPLDKAVDRANKLRRLRVVLTNLQQAFANAKLNERSSIYENIDMVSCRQAFSMLFERFSEDAEIEVTIDPVGTKPLLSFNEICEFSHQAALASVQFPSDEGNRRLRRLVRRQFKATYPTIKLRKLSVNQKRWTENDAGDRRELRFTVGIERKNVFPEDPCVMQELSIYQNKIGARFSATECCDIREVTPILCELLD